MTQKANFVSVRVRASVTSILNVFQGPNPIPVRLRLGLELGLRLGLRLELGLGFWLGLGFVAARFGNTPRKALTLKYSGQG